MFAFCVVNYAVEEMFITKAVSPLDLLVARADLQAAAGAIMHHGKKVLRDCCKHVCFAVLKLFITKISSFRDSESKT